MPETEKSAGSAGTAEKATRMRKAASTNARFGITLEEAVQILNIPESLPKEEMQKQYDHLFEMNEKKNGGTLYLQSKVYRAKERIDEEFKLREPPPPPTADASSSDASSSDASSPSSPSSSQSPSQSETQSQTEAKT